jgi:hypothetical protein
MPERYASGTCSVYAWNTVAAEGIPLWLALIRESDLHSENEVAPLKAFLRLCHVFKAA